MRFSHSYCTVKNWLYHGKNFHERGLDREYKLWKRLADGLGNTAETPWAPEHLIDVGERFIGWTMKNHHDALATKATQILGLSSPLGELEDSLELLSHGSRVTN